MSLGSNVWSQLQTTKGQEGLVDVAAVWALGTTDIGAGQTISRTGKEALGGLTNFIIPKPLFLVMLFSLGQWFKAGLVASAPPENLLECELETSFQM